MKTAFLPIALFFLYATTYAQNKHFNIYTDSLKLKSDNNAIIADFEKRIKNIDPKFDFKGMTTIIENGAPTGYYLPKTNNIYLPYWETMPQIFKDFGTNLTSSKAEGEDLAGLFYYGFFLPHEIGHGLQYNAKKLHDNKYEDPKKYFTSHYEEFIQDPNKYGYSCSIKLLQHLKTRHCPTLMIILKV